MIPKTRRSVRRLVLIAVAALVASTVGSVAAAVTTAQFAVDMAPGCAAPNTSVTFSATIRNESTSQNLGSVNITAPEGFTVTAIVTPPGTGTATFDATTVRLRSLSLAPAGSVEVAFQVTTPAAGTYSWHDPTKPSAGRFEAKPTPDFSGTATFSFDALASHVDTVVGSCGATVVCTGSGCTGQATFDGTTVEVTAPDAEPGDVISVSLDATGLDCPGYTPLAGTPVVTFTVTGDSIRIVKIRVPAALATRPRTQDRVCYGSELAFVDITGATTNVGLLPPCSTKSPAVPPCQLLTIVAKPSGDHIISFMAPPGSTKGRT